MICSSFVHAVLLLASWIHVVDSEPKRLPIGVLVDVDHKSIGEVFRREILRHNSDRTSEFHFELYESLISNDNNVDLKKSVCSILSRGVMTVFGQANNFGQSLVDSLIRTFRIPYVTTTSVNIQDGGAASAGFALYVRPGSEEAMADLVEAYGWKRFAYLYDSSEGLGRIQEFFQSMERRQLDIQLTASHLTDVNRSYIVLRKLDSQMPPDERNIIIDATSNSSLHNILQQIIHLGMHRAGYNYIIGGLAFDEVPLDRFRFGGATATGFRLIDNEADIRRSGSCSNRPETKMEDVNMQIADRRYCQVSSLPSSNTLDESLALDAATAVVSGLTSFLRAEPDIYRQIFRRGVFYNNDTLGMPCADTPPTPWIYGPKVIKHMKKTNFNGFTGAVAFDKRGYRTAFQLDILQITLDKRPAKIGTWHSLRRLNMTYGVPVNRSTNQITPTRSRLKGNITRIVISVMTAPYMTRIRNPGSGESNQPSILPHTGERQILLNEGYCIDLVTRIAKVVGFNFTLRAVKDGQYGIMASHNDTNSWNGIVGELVRGEADIAVAPLTITASRERVVDFSKPFMSVGVSIMIKRPEKMKPGIFSFLQPLSLDIWMCIVLTYMGVSIILHVVSRASSVEWHLTASGPPAYRRQIASVSFANTFTLKNSMWFSLGSFMRQGCDISPRSLAGRVVGSSWWFFTLIIISSYTANLAAFLTVERMLTPIESADDLAKQSEILYGTLRNGSTREFFETTQVPIYRTMWSFMMSSDPGVFVDTIEEGVTKVRNSKGKYAFLLESTMNDYHNQRKPCNTMKIGGLLDFKGYGVATPIGSDLRDPVGLAVLQLLEEGVLQKLQKKWWYDKGDCPTEADTKGGSTQSALTLSNVAGIFYILIAGLMVSMFVSLLEFLCKSKLEATRQQMALSEYIKIRYGKTTDGVLATVSSTAVSNPSNRTVPALRSSAISLV